MPDARLGQPERRQLLALRLGHEPALLLLLGPPLHEGQRVEPDVDALDDPEGGVGPLELLADDGEAEVVHPARRPSASWIGAPRKPSSAIRPKTSRWTSPFSSHSRMWGWISRLGEVADGLLDEAVLVGRAKVDRHGAE